MINNKVEDIACKLGSFAYVLRDINDNNQYVAFDENNQELYHVYDDLISYKLANNQDIILYPNGECFIPFEKKSGVYGVDNKGNIICNFDGKIELYNHNLFYTDTDDSSYFYEFSSDLQGITKNGKTNYSKKNHIEYNEEEYHALMTTLVNLGQSAMSGIDAACSSVDAILNSMSPESYGGDTSGIRSAAQAQVDSINELNTTINYSLLAYDACDASLKELVDNYLITSLFDDNLLGDDFKKIIAQSIEDRDGDRIFEFSRNTDFNELEKNIEHSIKLEEEFNEEVQNLKLWNFNMYNNDILSKMSDIEIKKELYDIKNTLGEDGLEQILYILKKQCPDNFANYQFHPEEQKNEDEYYNYNPDTINNYNTNSEFITLRNILGGLNEFEIAQVLPKDCTNLERIAYDIVKANILNTIRCAPGVMLKHYNWNEIYHTDERYDRNLLILTCDPNSQNTKFIDGYYWQKDMNDSGAMVIDANAVMNGIMNPDKENYYEKVLPVTLLTARYMPKVRDNYSYPQPYQNHYYEVDKWIELQKKNGNLAQDVNVDDIYINTIVNLLTTENESIDTNALNKEENDLVIKDVLKLFKFYRGSVANGMYSVYKADNEINNK